MPNVIEVKNITKEYNLGTLTSLKDTLLNQYNRIRGLPVEKRARFKALNEVSFGVEAGEVLGIIGHNGAGKSTLLKILAGIVTPTSGSVDVKGKVAPLIEVGAGLVPDMTGRENIYLNATILGMKRAEIDKKFDEIVAFSELEEFIDTPIKRYSSGMQVKLGFSIATSVDADILIVDEVLAVGDLAFQRKCFQRVEDLIKQQGKTVLLVSHNIRQVVRLCTRVLLLDHGKITADGEAFDVSERFYEQSNKKIQENQTEERSSEAKIKSSGEVELLDITLLDSSRMETDEIVSGDALRVRLKLLVHKGIKKPEVIVGTHTTDFVYLTAGSTAVFEDRLDFDEGIHEVEYIIPSFPLVTGTYCIRLTIFDANGRLMLTGETLKMFHVDPLPGESNQPPLRNLHLPTDWLIDGKQYSEQPGKLD
jgi:ABC-type polysaccharide/polyol phosphate transport system ATPase subunit